MAKQGRATEALQLSFGPSHLFWMAVLGVTVIASLASDSIIKGLAAGCLGLWISTIGYDSVQGVDKFTFTSHLDGGINIISALVGLFAIPQVIDMLARCPSSGAVQTMQPHALSAELVKYCKNQKH